MRVEPPKIEPDSVATQPVKDLNQNRFFPSPAVLLGLVLLIALVLRLANIGGKSLWLDEAFSVFQGSRPELAQLVDVDPGHPPLYFTLLHYWMPVFGDSEASVRIPSTLASMVAVGLLFLLGRRIGGNRIGITAASLMALAPLDIWYAQEARMFSFVVLSGVVMALGLASNRWWGGVVLSLGLGIGAFFDYLVLPLWVTLMGIWLVLWWGQGRRVGPFLYVIIGSIAGLGLFSFWWPNLARQLAAGLPTVFIINRIWEFLQLPTFNAVQFFFLLTIIFLLAFVATLLTRHVLKISSGYRIIATVILLIFVIVTLSMLIPRLYSLKRFLVIGWPLAILLLSWLVIKQHSGRRSLIALGGLSLLVSLFAIFFLPKDDWRGATGLLDTQVELGEVVWIDPEWNQFPYRYYRPGVSFEIGSNTRLENFASSATGIWIIAERFPGEGVPSSESERWLDENWQIVSATPFYNLEVRHYKPGE